MTLLDYLKEMKENDYPFVEAKTVKAESWQNQATEDLIIKDIGGQPIDFALTDYGFYHLPTVPEVEERVVEICAEHQWRLSILFYGIWLYDIKNFSDSKYYTPDSDRLLAVCQLWIKLKKQEK